MSTRREFLKAAAGASLFLPSWLLQRPQVQHLDLSPFCDAGAVSWDLRTPFHQIDESGRGMTYATDKTVCVRTDLPVDCGDAPEARRPPAAGLPWNHDALRGWRPLRTVPRVATDVSGGYVAACGDCHGIGRLGAEICDVTGDYVGGIACAACGGRGNVEYCYELHGQAVSPSVLERLLRLGDVEYAHADGLAWRDWVQGRCGYAAEPPTPVRFDGGEGFFCSLDWGHAWRRK